MDNKPHDYLKRMRNTNPQQATATLMAKKHVAQPFSTIEQMRAQVRDLCRNPLEGPIADSIVEEQKTKRQKLEASLQS
jgi:hypothetical protein